MHIHIIAVDMTQIMIVFIAIMLMDYTSGKFCKSDCPSCINYSDDVIFMSIVINMYILLNIIAQRVNNIANSYCVAM